MTVHNIERRLARAGVAQALFGAAGEPARVGRFELVRRLGRGAMGTVYQARDPASGAGVALKVLSRFDGVGIYRLKREFRSLSDVVHPNLVALNELFSDQEQWFFTMELVDGVWFDRWVRPAGAGPDETRLHSALQQLALGVNAVHAAGKLHCDLKPSNVLVTRDGRVVVLDFGLVSELALDDRAESGRTGLVGTPAYMAPEQAAGQHPTQASDWYALGVMLFEALVGRLPFEGTPLAVLREKQQRDAPDPRDICSELPRDLSELCVGLLRRDAMERFGREAVGAVLGSTTRQPVARLESVPPPRPVFVGRQEQLALLHEALGSARGGEAVAMLFGGRSGMGKSALLERFAETVGPSTLVLSGRCHEQESVPYKVLDSVVDALSRHLRKLSTNEAVGLLPRHALALVRLFPVLGQIPALSEAAAAGRATDDARELRNQAFAAIKELLLRLTDRVALVLIVDDLQWGDIDSARMLAHVFGPPEPPPLLFVGAYRSDEVGSSAFLREVLNEHGDNSGWHPRLLEIGPLAAETATELVRELLAGSHGDAPPAEVTAIATEAQGVPFFIAELAQHHKGRSDHAEPSGPMHPISLEQVLLERIALLSSDAQRLLEILSVAAGPVEQSVAFDAGELAPGDRSALLSLRAARLTRTRGSNPNDLIETYHDRVRETVVRNMEADAVRLAHARIARAMERGNIVDPERLVVHYSGAEEHVRAGDMAARAAHAAAQKLAFNRAVELFEKAIELLPSEDARRRNLNEHLGDALANAGRGALAAEAYLIAAEGARPAEERRLQRMAVQQYFRSGRIKEGTTLAKSLLSAVGTRWPATPQGAIASVGWSKLVLATRGLEYSLREESQLSVQARERLDVLGSMFGEVGVFDVLRGVALQLRFLREALAAGEPHRILRGLAWEASNTALVGGRRNELRAERVLYLCEQLANNVGTPYARAILAMAGSGCSVFCGRFREAAEAATRAEVIFREQCPGSSWEQRLMTTVRLCAVEQTGDLAQIVREAPDLTRQAHETDDQFFAGFLALSVPLSHLLTDQPRQAVDLLDERRRALGAEFLTTSFWVMGRTIDTLLYLGRATEALEHHLNLWPRFRKSHLYRAKPFFVIAQWMRARSAIAAALQSGDDASLAIAEHAVRTLENTGRSDALCWALLARSGIAKLRGNEDGARRCLTKAIEQCRAQQLDLFAIYAERNLGLLLGGSEGARHVATADEALRAQAVTNPERWTAMNAPGFARI